MKIAVGVGEGLQYLHEQTLDTFASRSITSTNVMLFNGYEAKIGDFSLSNASEEMRTPFDPEHEYTK